MKANFTKWVRLELKSILAMGLTLTMVFSSCELEEVAPVGLNSPSSAAGDAVAIVNPGFESNWTGWDDTDPSATSSDSHSGSKSAKITGSAGRVEQAVNVSSNTNYTLTAYVLEKGTIGVIAGSDDYSDGGNYSDWTDVTVSFNSGSNTSVTIYGKYNGGTGRFDDFSLVEGSGSGSNPGTGTTPDGKLTVSSVTASTDDGNVPANTLDGQLGTRWSAKGSGQYITYDLGATTTVSSLKIAWFKGDQRASIFKIRVGESTSALTEVYSGTSSGSSLELETYEFASTTARYVRVTGLGNSANTWNSITETEIYGSAGSGGVDTSAPGEISGLTAVAGDGQVTLSWSNPSDSDFESTTITATPNSYTTTLSGTSKTVTGLANGTVYTFTLKTKDTSGNESTGISVSSTPVSGGGSNPGTGTANVPSDLMENCNQWKITYPDGVEDKTLCNEANNEYFYVNEDKNAIVFKVPIRSNNGSTPNSDYIRSELRERTETGGSDVYWTTSGTHAVYSKQAITHLPMNKNHLVATQIHGNKSDGIDDAMVLRLEGSHLFLSFNGGVLRSNLTIKTNYSLGTVHEVIFEVINGKHYCYYSEDGNLASTYASGNASSYLVKDGSNSYVMNLNYDQSYFKIGNYTQSNPEKEGSDTDNPNNYGEVLVYDFWVAHN